MLQVYYRHEYQRQSNNAVTYNLDEDALWGSLPSGYEAGRVDSLSDYTRNDLHSNEFGLRTTLNWRKVRLNIRFGLSPQKSTTKSNRGKVKIDTTITVLNIVPELHFDYDLGNNHNMSVYYSGYTRQPSIYDLLSVPDYTNPLNITMGNPGLKPAFGQSISVNYRGGNMEKQEMLYCGLRYNNTINDISRKRTYDEKMIINRVQDTLEGNMREIVGQMRLEEMVTDRKAFGERVQENAIPDLQKMGLEMISFNVQSFADQNNVIEDLGIDNISQIKKGAAVAKAQADRDIAIAQAQAAKEANEAKVQSEMEIAEKQTSLAIRQAELKQQSDVKKAEADAAYSIQEQEQRKTIEIASANADIARAERTAELKAKEVDVTKQTLDAQIRAKADAERYAAQQAAEAELFRRTKEAEAKMIERKREAEGIRAVGEAEAEAIKLKALAEAEGIDKKAEAMKKYGEAAVVEMIMNALPEIAKNVAEPLSKVDKITMYGEGNSAKLLSDIVNGTTQVTEGIASGMGIDIKSLIMGALGGKLASGGKNDAPVVVVQPSTEAAATQNNKTE